MGKIKVISQSVLAILLVLAAIFSVAFAIDENSAKEQPCFKVTNAVDPDEKWTSSVTNWYYTLASRLDLYRTVHDLLETDYKNIRESSVYYDSCVHTTQDAKGITLRGFNGRKRLLRTTQVAPGTVDYKSEWSKGMVGRAYTTLTDNKTFVFYAACFADNQMTWNVFQTVKTLDESTRQQIFQHAVSLGYNPEYFTELKQESCGNNEITDMTPTGGDRDSNNAPSSIPAASDGVPAAKDFDSLICNACKRVCPNQVSKPENLRWYKKRIQKYKELCAMRNKH